MLLRTRRWWRRQRRSRRSNVSGDLLDWRGTVCSRGSIGAAITSGWSRSLGAHLNYELHISLFFFISSKQCCYHTMMCVGTS